MGSVNRVTLLGNLGADPELRYTPQSKPVCNLRIATTDVRKDKSGQKTERTEWHRVTVWGDMAENCAKYLSKGRQVYVEGRLETRTFEKNGEKRYATDVIASQVVFLGGGEREARGGSGENPPREGQTRSTEQASAFGGPSSGEPYDSDIPF